MGNPQRALTEIVLAPGHAVTPDAGRGVDVRVRHPADARRVDALA